MNSNLVFRKALLEDIEAILKLGGSIIWDYLPIAIGNWIQEAQESNSNRENYVLTSDGIVVGFVSLYFICNGSKCLKFSFRIREDIRGKGLGRAITSMLETRLKTDFPDVKSIISAISDRNMKDNEIDSPKHGTIISLNTTNVYTLKLQELLLSDNFDEQLQIVQKTEFTALLMNKTFHQLFPNNVIQMNWVPSIPNTEKDIEFVTRKKQLVMVSKDHTSLSIMTLPFCVHSGLRIGIDFFAESRELLEKHVYSQLSQLKDYVGKMKLKLDYDVWFEITMSAKLDGGELMCQIGEKLGLEKFRNVSGTENRKYPKMYIYEKTIK